MKYLLKTSPRIFLGRQQERSHLDRLYRSTLSGNFKIGFISGETGIGKTALVEKFWDSIRADASAPQFAGFCCVQDRTRTGFAPFMSITRSLYNLDESETEARIARTKRAVQMLGIIKNIAPAWLELAFSQIAGPFATPVFKTTEELVKFFLPAKLLHAPIYSQPSVFEQFSHMLAERSKIAPLILFLDDIDAIDESSLEMLLYLAKNSPQGRILLIAAYDPALLDDVHRNVLDQIIAAGAFVIREKHSELDVAQYLSLRYPGNDFPEKFIESVQEQSEGFPGYVDQLMSLLEDRGFIGEFKNQTGQVVRYSLADLDQALQILKNNQSTNSLVAVRINSLTEELKKILCIASVEGEDFTAEVIARVERIGKIEMIDELSKLAVRHQLIASAEMKYIDYEKILSIYRFSHRFIQEYVYHGVIDDHKRRSLHGEVGSILEEIYQNHLEEISGQLSRHFIEAGDDDKGVRYALLASKTQFLNYSFSEASHFAKQAFEIAIKQSIKNSLAQSAEAVVLLGKCADRTGEFSQVVPLLENVARRFDKNAEKTKEEEEIYREVLLALGRAHYSIGNNTESETISWQVVRIAERDGDLAKQYEAKYLLQDVIGDNLNDYEQQMEICQELYVIAKKLNDFYRQIDMLEMIAWVNLNVDDFETAISYCRQAEELIASSAMDDPILISLLHRVKGLANAKKGDYETAALELNKALSIYEELGDNTRISWLQYELGHVHLELKQYDQAEERFVKGLNLARKIDLSGAVVWFKTALAKVYLEVGKRERVPGLLREVFDQSDALNGEDLQDIYLVSARYHFITGELPEAKEDISKSLEIVETIRSASMKLPIYLLSGDIALAEGEIESAREWYEKSLQAAESTRQDHWKGLCYKRLASFHQLQGSDQEAWKAYEKAYRSFDGLMLDAEIDEIWDDFINAGIRTGHIVRLKQAYASKFKAPQIEYIDLEILNRRYFTDCLNCDFCSDVCCSYGADIEIRVLRNISGHSDQLVKEIDTPKAEWFTDIFKRDAEYPGGTYTRTQQKQGKCVFLDRRSRGCKLHQVSNKVGVDYHDLKPMVCCLFPVTFNKGLLLPSTEVYTHELVCLDQGPSIYQGTRSDLFYYFGQEFIDELDEIEQQHLSKAA